MDLAHKKIRLRLCANECKTKKQGQDSKSLTCFSVESLHCHHLNLLKAFVSIMMSVSWSNKGKPSKLRHYDIINRAHITTSSRGSPEVLVKTKVAD